MDPLIGRKLKIPRKIASLFLPVSVALLFLFLSFSLPPAWASWLLEPERYHVSIHGQISCQDCHEDLAERELHPDPQEVNKPLGEFFSAEQCFSCHDTTEDDLNEGIHGSLKVKDPQTYKPCLRCHDPHYQLAMDQAKSGPFDPNRPIREQCGTCHELRKDLPPFYPEDKACTDCHVLPAAEGPQMKEKVSSFCFHCHGNNDTQAQLLTARILSPIDQKEYPFTVHQFYPCTGCHLQSARFPHKGQSSGDCGQCHFRHPAKTAHDAHMEVSCEACHLNQVEPIRDPVTRRVLWKRPFRPGAVSHIHLMFRGEKETSCRRCHFSGNVVGAASIILPPKSVLCMPCHSSTVSFGDPTTALSLAVFLVGAFWILSYVLTGRLETTNTQRAPIKLFLLAGQGIRTVFSRGLSPILKVLALDVVLQRRLFRRSRLRWVIHGLIFFPFLIRFLWGIVALATSSWRPGWNFVWAMLDAHHPFTALLFDLTGIMLILGVLCALIRGWIAPQERLPDLPRQDHMALSLIGSIVVVGFLLEGIRMAMTGWPVDPRYAFVGYWISRLFSSNGRLTDVYGTIWYVHAILTGLFVAYVPFSRLLHIIMAPLVLTMGAASRGDQNHP